MRWKKKTAGSLLFEIAIGISIMGVITGGVMSYFSISNKAIRGKITRDNIETVVMAISSFLANNHKLPKPARDCNGIADKGSGEAKFVPYVTLGITKKMASDGNNRPLYYVVEPELTEETEGIYDEETGNSFCRGIVSNLLNVTSFSKGTVAFVVDNLECNLSFSDANINVIPTENGMCISRDILLMKYLKGGPCAQIKYPTSAQRDMFGF